MYTCACRGIAALICPVSVQHVEYSFWNQPTRNNLQKHYQKAKKAFKISKEACQLNADITSLFSQSKTDEDVQKSETSLCQNIFFCSVN